MTDRHFFGHHCFRGPRAMQLKEKHFNINWWKKEEKNRMLSAQFMKSKMHVDHMLLTIFATRVTD